jgi:hypothetical protein
MSTSEPIDFATAAAVRALTREFHGRVDAQEVRQVVEDCYERLVTHVPRTVHSYLMPWARHRLTRRLQARREPSLNEILAVPLNRL